MGLFGRFRSPREVELAPHQVPYFEDEELRELAEELGFAWPRDRGKLSRIHKHLAQGGSFDVVKEFSTPGGNRTMRRVASFDNFPSFEQIVDRCEGSHGGGVYHVTIAGDMIRVLKTYTLEGEPKVPAGTSSRKSVTNSIKDDLQAAAAEGLREALEADPTIKTRLGLAMMEKSLKVSLNGQESEDPIQRLIDTAQQLKDLQGVLGGDSADSWKSVVAEVGKSLAQPLGLTLKSVIEANQRAQQQGTHQHVVQGKGPANLPPAGSPERPPQTHPVTGADAYHPEQEEPDYEEPVELDFGGINWSQLLLSVNWQEVKAHSEADPTTFIEWLAATAIQNQSEAHDLLFRLFLTHNADQIVARFNQGLEALDHPFVRPMVMAAGKGKDAAVIGEVVRRLRDTQQGRKWLAEAHQVAVALYQRLQQQAAGQRQSGQAQQPRDHVPEEGTASPESQQAEMSRAAWLESLGESGNGHRDDPGEVAQVAPHVLDQDQDDQDDTPEETLL